MTRKKVKVWTKEILQKTLKTKLKDYLFIIASNREPYIHEYSGKTIKWVRAVSGLTVALDPVMQACKGIWIAYGSGDADKDTVDKADKVNVPPDKPRYTLRRVWLTKEEETGYYYGYANQSLWPLSHIAYQQPIFNESYWNYYQIVNKKFADAILDEIKNEKAFVWLQDYHLIQCSRYIKEKRKNVVTALFWHIPWPNPEVFRICPQKKQILEGLLANDLLGFHIHYHCYNFLSTVEQELEAKVNREEFSVVYQGHKTLVRPFPISVDAEEISKNASTLEVTKNIEKIPHEIDPPYEIFCLGIDRVDYTKGIIEKIKAVDRFLEKYPEYQSRFVYLQLGVLSRLRIQAYKNLINSLQALAEEVNWKYRSGYWYPIVLVNTRFDYEKLLAYYRSADICLVGSLHDGMNLVAKEFMMANVDLKGMLVLSQFTGAARELKEAILINPYDTEGFADGIYKALNIPRDEKVKRIKKMREDIFENNIYKWAENFIGQLVKLE